MAALILLVDDEPTIRRLLRHGLEAEGYGIAEAGNAVQAMAAIDTALPDLVILDVVLPDVSGIDFCRKLRSQEATADLPIIMLSNRTAVDDRVAGLEAGADEYVVKPVDTKEMAARVRALLAMRVRLSHCVPQQVGRIVGFMGAKGGVGTTSLAVNVAAALAARGNSVTAVELRSVRGSFASHFARPARQDLSSLAALTPEQLTDEVVGGLLVEQPSGVRVLYGPPGTAGPEPVPSPEVTEALLGELARTAQFTVLDVPSWPLASTAVALGKCELLVLVSEATPEGLRAGQAACEMLDAWAVGGTLRALVVVNRSPALMAAKAADIAAALHMPLLGVVPHSAEAFFRAYEHAAPVVVLDPTDPAAASILQIADRIIEGSLRPVLG
jgi:CheY-like chemotaxis protein